MKNKTFKTFQPGLINPNNITTPAVFNGMCLIRKYLVTVKEIEVSSDVLKKRLTSLWNNTTNHHDRATLSEEARKLGIDLREK